MVLNTIAQRKDTLATRPQWETEDLNVAFARIWEGAIKRHFDASDPVTFQTAGAPQKTLVVVYQDESGNPTSR